MAYKLLKVLLIVLIVLVILMSVRWVKVGYPSPGTSVIVLPFHTKLVSTTAPAPEPRGIFFVTLYNRYQLWPPPWFPDVKNWFRNLRVEF